ncbi:hypothetical protein P692DRAFT_201807078 [Suillus brevipes Sb2]|nr:hypothetical protein P692DRAFT_201807078 [Suillus brevipes Sb2]
MACSNFALSCIAFVRNLAFDVFVSLARTQFTTAIYKLVLQHKCKGHSGFATLSRLPDPSPPRHGAYLPAVPFTGNANKENVPVVLKSPLANIFGGPSGIPKLIPPPALPPSTQHSCKRRQPHQEWADRQTTGGADVKKGSKMRPGATKNGRNLCALRWLNKINKNGTTDEFKLYFNGLSPAQQKQYQTEADDLISASSWNKASDSAVVDGALH